MTKIQNKAMLAVLSRRVWSAAVSDSQLARNAESETEATTGSLAVIKKLVNREYLAPIHAVSTLGYAEHLRLTVPGFMRGQHILATRIFEDYATIQGTIKEQFERRVSDFLKVYPDIVKGAEARFGRAYRAADFPSVAKIKTFFEYDVKFQPIPTIHDWRLEGLSTEDNAQLKKEAEAAQMEVFNGVTAELMSRAKDTLQSFADQVRKLGTSGHGIKEASLANLKDMALLITKMNINEDPALQRLGYELIEQFDECQIEMLRESEPIRQAVSKKADEILQRFKK